MSYKSKRSRLFLSGVFVLSFYVFLLVLPNILSAQALGSIDVRDYGALCDGVTNDTPSIQAALDAAMSSGATVMLPIGTCVIESPGLLWSTGVNHAAGLILIGAGRNQTILDSRVENGAALTLKSTLTNTFQDAGRLQDFAISINRDLVVPVDLRPANSDGIVIKSNYQLLLDNVQIFNLTGDGVKIQIDNGDADGPVQLTFRRSWFQQNSGYGIHVAGTSNINSFMSVENSFITGNLSGGISWRGTEARIINNGITLNEGAGGFQARYNGSSNANLVMENNDFEHNKNRDLDIDGLIGGMFINNQFIGTLCEYPKTEEIRVGHTAGSANLVFINNEIREGTCQNPNVAFSIGVNTTHTRIERTRWSVFDAAGQTRFVDNGTNTQIFDDGREFPYPQSSLNTTLSAPGSYTPNLNKYKIHNLTFTAPGAYTINAPTTTGAASGKEMTLDLFNNSGGAVTVTWDNGYKLQGYSNPINGVHRTVQFYFNSMIGWMQSAQNWLGSPGFTLGSIPYTASDGSLTQNNAQLFWNNSLLRLGIGTANPAQRIDAVGNIFLFGADAASSTTRTDSTAKNMYFALPHYTNSQLPLFLIGGQNTSGTNDIYIGNSFTGNANAATSIRFATATSTTGGAGVERMRIDSMGNVGIGTNNPSTDKLVVVGNIRVGSSGTNGCIENFAGTALTGSCSSDINLKKNIKPLTNLLDKFTQLQPVTYQWRTGEFPERSFGSGPVKGLIAQDVEKLFPELVGVDDRGFKTVDYGISLLMMSIEAIKELSLKINNIFIETKAWLADAGNGIADVFAGTFHAKDKLCINDTCVTESQLQEILRNTGESINNNGDSSNVLQDRKKISQ